MRFTVTERHCATLLILTASCLLCGCGLKIVRENANDFVLHSTTHRDELIAKYSQPSSSWQAPYTNATTDSAKLLARNDILNDLLWLADDYYGQLTTGLYNNNAWRETLFDAAKLGLGAAGAVVGGADLKAILAATGTGVQGLNSSIDKNFLEQKTVEAIISAMDSQRTDDQKALVAGMVEKADKYPLSQGLLDVKKYALDSTLTHALIALAKKSNSAADTSKAELNRVRSAHERNQTQLLINTHQAVDGALTNSASYNVESLRQMDNSAGRRLAVERAALLKTTLQQVDETLKQPFLPEDERIYFTNIKTQLESEYSTLSSAYNLQ